MHNIHRSLGSSRNNFNGDNPFHIHGSNETSHGLTSIRSPSAETNSFGSLYSVTEFNKNIRNSINNLRNLTGRPRNDTTSSEPESFPTPPNSRILSPSINPKSNTILSPPSSPRLKGTKSTSINSNSSTSTTSTTPSNMTTHAPKPVLAPVPITAIRVENISWNNIILPQDPSGCVIGKGAFGVVIKATLQTSALGNLQGLYEDFLCELLNDSSVDMYEDKLKSYESAINSTIAVAPAEINSNSNVSKPYTGETAMLLSHDTVLHSMAGDKQKGQQNSKFSSSIASPTAPRNGAGLNVTVAIKILNQTNIGDIQAVDRLVRAATKEIQTMKSVESRITNNCTVKVYGLVRGKLPPNISRELKYSELLDVVGIVMRFEGGGSLQSLIHNPSSRRHTLDMREKLRLLKGIARGLTELHSIGIIHADIKPDNVLLSEDSPPQIRLADFGLATIREENSLTMSTLVETNHAVGTPIYSAPELLYNPFGDDLDSSSLKIAKPSRKSDVYAFAIMAWELLTEKRAFSQAANLIMLNAMIHQGQRPSLKELPVDCPPRISELLECCWAADRAKRNWPTNVIPS
ncbi:unnamed protein product [Sphagnum balticum]